jgi:ABC-type multidrug transport system fused ATPase/permease subunit
MRGRTVLVIAHRLSTVRRAERIVVLDHGSISEVGSHEDLIGRGGMYQKLHDLQFVDAEP